MGLDLPSHSMSGPLNFGTEEIEILGKQRKTSVPHPFHPPSDDGSVRSRGSMSSLYSSGSTVSTRSSVSSAPSSRYHSYHRPQASYTSSIPSISERSESPEMFRANVTPTLSRPQLSRSLSEYSLRDRAATFRSFPSQQDFVIRPLYFCTFCSNGFESRADWETHEWLFHERQSYWPCPHPDCEAIFDSGHHFEMHHEARHSCFNCKHAAEVVRLLPERKAWACGFDQCKAVFMDWSKRCKHVASHYEGLARRHGSNRETPKWTYSNSMRNLLRQAEIRDPFKKFMIKCHGHAKSSWPKLEWHQDDKSFELRRCLEYRDFSKGIAEIIHMAYRLGHPAYNEARQLTSRPPSPPLETTSRNHSRVQSADSAVSGSGAALHLSPSSPPARGPRSYLYERQVPSLSTLPEWGPLPLRTKDYSMSRSLPSSPPDASPPRTRPTSPERSTSLNSEMMRGHVVPRKRMIAREADVKGTGCAALIHFLRQGPPDTADPAAPMLEHRAKRVPSPRPSTPLERTTNDTLSKPLPTLPSLPTPPPSASHQTPAAPPASPTGSFLLVPETPLSIPPSPQPPATPLSLWPSTVSAATSRAVTPEIVSTEMTILSHKHKVSLSLTAPPPSPLPDMTGMNWPLPPPSRSVSPVPPRPATSAGEHIRRPSMRGKARSLRWVSISGIADPPMPSPDFGSCLTQPLDLLQPVAFTLSPS